MSHISSLNPSSGISPAGMPVSIPEWNPQASASSNIDLTLLRAQLAELIRQLREHVRTSDTVTLQAASLVTQIKTRVQRGDAGKGISWMEFAMNEMPLKKSRIYVLERIGRAKDPQKELEVFMSEQREAKKKKEAEWARRRALKKVPERKALREWAMRAPEEAVRFILEDAQRQFAISLR